MSILTIIIFLLVLSVLVFVHEFGHFITAKKSGIRVDEFGFGFPPRLFGIKKGDTIYSVNLIPLGGFVRIKGEDGSGKSDPDSFAAKSIGRRMVIILAGVIMNVVLTAVLLSIGALVGMPRVIDGEIRFGKVRDAQIQVVSILPGSPAERAGIETGDVIISANGKEYIEVEELRAHISANSAVNFKLKRNGQELELSASTELLPQVARVGIGVGLLKTGIVSYPWYIAPWKGVSETGFYIKEITFAFGRILGDLFLGQPVSVDLSGPVGIAVIAGKVARLGFIHLLQFAALLSINLAFINVLPFPALDGGRMLFLAIEGAFRKPVSRKVEAIIHNIGFVILIMLVLLVTYRDLVRYSSGFFSRFGG